MAQSATPATPSLHWPACVPAYAATMRILTMLLIAFCLLSTLAAAEPQRKGAYFNPRISNRSIAMNQAVHVVFTTIPAQLTEVAIVPVVRTALDLPEARAHWRLLGEPEVAVHERLKTIQVSFALLPRQAGTLTLPDIPVRWLEGDQMAHFGDITVADGIKVGNDIRPVPLEHNRVLGYAWESSFEDLVAALGRDPLEQGTEPDSGTFRPREEVRIDCRAGSMWRIQLDTADLALAEVRHHFIDRWGEAIIDHLDEQPPSLTWLIGWLRIEAEPLPTGGTRLRMVREDVADQILAERVNSAIFDILDGK